MKQLILMAAFIAMIMLPGCSPAKAAQPDWALRTNSSNSDAASQFCAVEQIAKDGDKITIARNLIGQYSLILVIPGQSSPADGPVTVRLSADGQASRQISGIAKGDDTVSIPLGWDDSLMKALMMRNRLSVGIGTQTRTLSLRNTSLALGQLASCANSLLEKSPDSSGLPPPLRHVVERAGLKGLRLVQMQADKPKAASDGVNWAWMYNGVFGGVDEMTVKPDTALDSVVLDYVDRLEKLCQGQFSSEIGASETGDKKSIADVDITCRDDYTTTMSFMVFVQAEQTVRVFFAETDQSNRQKLLQQKTALLEAARQTH